MKEEGVEVGLLAKPGDFYGKGVTVQPRGHQPAMTSAEKGEQTTVQTKVKHPTSYLETLVHLLKGNIGSGMFAMGDAFKNAGILAGPVLTLFLGVVCIYNNHVLVKCSNKIMEMKKLDHSPDFPETVEMCFEAGPPRFKRFTNLVRRSVKTFVIVTQLGFCCVYFVFVSTTLQNVLSPGGISLDLRVYMAAMLVPVIASCLIRSLKFLAPISLLSNVLVISSVVLTLYKVSANGLPSPAIRPLVVHYSRLPLFLGTVVYAFEGISLILPLQNEMRDKRQFGGTFGVLNVGLSIVTSLLILVGFIGYLKFGEDVKGSLSLNLPPEPFSSVVQLVLAVGIVFSYALQFYVAAELIWADVVASKGPFLRPLLLEALLKVALILFTMILAAVIPQLGLFISLVGAVSSTALALVFPALIDISLRTAEERPLPHSSAAFLMDGLTLAIAAFVFLTGTYCSLAAIVEAFVDQASSS